MIYAGGSHWCQGVANGVVSLLIYSSWLPPGRHFECVASTLVIIRCSNSQVYGPDTFGSMKKNLDMMRLEEWEQQCQQASFAAFNLKAMDINGGSLPKMGLPPDHPF